MTSPARTIIFIVWLISLYSYDKKKLQEIKSESKNYRESVEKLVFQNFRALIGFFIIVDLIGPFVVALINK